MTIGSSHGFNFQCRFSEALLSDGYFYSCDATVVNSGSNTTLMDVLGTHVLGFGHGDVTRLAVYHQHILTSFPKNIEQFFPNLEVIDFWNGTFTTISESDLVPFEDLQVFAVSNQLIESLPGNLFSNNTKLRRINFSVNRLKYVGKNLLDNLPHLVVARFFKNTCVDFNATSSEDIEELKQIFKNDCQVELTTTSTTTTVNDTSTAVTTTTDPTDQCPEECIEEIQYLNYEIEELSRQEIENAEVILRLTSVLKELVML